jgi:hypothetical protein
VRSVHWYGGSKVRKWCAAGLGRMLNIYFLSVWLSWNHGRIFNHSCSQWTKQSLHLWYKKINCKWVYCVCYSLVVMYWCEIEAAASMWIACVVMLLQIGILWYTAMDLAKRNYIFTLEIDIKYNKIVSLFVCFLNACKL